MSETVGPPVWRSDHEHCIECFGSGEVWSQEMGSAVAKLCGRCSGTGLESDDE